MDVRSRRLIFLGLIALLLSVAVSRRAKVRALAGARSSTESGTRAAALNFGGRMRTYALHVPPGYDAKTPLPLVFVLHGATESNDNVEQLSGMSVQADERHFLVVYPRGIGNLPTWNAGNCCGAAIQERVDDVGFLRALLAKLEHDYSVDRKRVYFTGISNGAMMSYRMACEMAGEVAAIAPVEGAQNIDCHPAAPVSVMIFHGTADRLVPFDGGFSTQLNKPVSYAVDFWVKQDGCPTPPAHEESAEAHIDRYTGCQGGAAVTLYAIQGGHHMWPGHPLSGNRVPATELMWSFFAAHPKP